MIPQADLITRRLYLARSICCQASRVKAPNLLATLLLQLREKSRCKLQAHHEADISPFLEVISDQQVQQTLGLMGQPKDARLTPEI